MKKERKTSGHSYLKYSGLAIQMFVLLFVAMWVGQKIDAILNLDNPYFTVALLLLMLGAFMFKLIRDVMQNKL